MKEFISVVLSQRDKFISESITYRDLNNIQKKVLNSQNLDNMNELRDKYEGVAFLDNFTLRIIGVLVLEKLLKREFFNWEMLNPRDYKPALELEGVKIDVITAEYGHLPIIKKNNDNPAIINIKYKQKDVWICGFASKELLDNHQTDKGLTAMATKDPESRAKFTGFNKLERFSNFEELLNLINKKNK